MPSIHHTSKMAPNSISSRRHYIQGYAREIKTLLVMFIACLLTIPGFVNCKGTAKDKPIHVTGLFPLSSQDESGKLGRGVLPAVELAMKHVKESEDVLQGYELVTSFNDTKVRRIEYVLKSIIDLFK